MDQNDNTRVAESAEADAAHEADRPPTRDEEQTADRLAVDIDVGEVGDHFSELTEVGANVKGEGAIEAGAPDVDESSE